MSFQELLVQLTNGPNRCAGRVEIFYFGSWYKVCGSLWDMNDALVLCRQLNCGSAVAALRNSYYGEGWLYPLMTAVNCTGSEHFLWECPNQHWPHSCDYYGDASVICSGMYSLFFSYICGFYILTPLVSTYFRLY